MPRIRRPTRSRPATARWTSPSAPATSTASRPCVRSSRPCERAEARLAAGTFGLSVESGAPISDARLERIPTAERTADEQREFERFGG